MIIINPIHLLDRSQPLYRIELKIFINSPYKRTGINEYHHLTSAVGGRVGIFTQIHIDIRK